MVALELFMGAVIAGLGFLLCAIGAVAWRRSKMAKMALTAAAFACAGAGGAAYTALLVLQGPLSTNAPLALSGGVALSLVVFYFALFGRAD